MKANALTQWIACSSLATAGVMLVAWTGGANVDGRAIPESRPECPTDSVLIVNTYLVKKTPVTEIVTTIPVAGPITNVPEYHDCQRFAPALGEKYGPLVAIFAHQGLDTLFADSTAPPVEAAAEIYSWDGEYPALAIKRGFNCLYLKRSGTSWKARMVPVDTAGACLHKQAGGEDLKVTSWKAKYLGDLPAVARWDWDSRASQQYISIRCGVEWCEVGSKTGFTSSALHPDGTLPSEPVPYKGEATAQEQQRVLTVKGWYDEQRIAVSDGASLLVSTTLGTAFPHPMLDRLGDTSDFQLQWIPVAYVLLNQEPPGYKKKLNLDVGLNSVYMCHGPFTRCPEIPVGTREPKCPVGADRQWWTMIVSARKDTVYRCIHRRVHHDVQIPGTVRWRWKETDETLWVRCPQGC